MWSAIIVIRMDILKLIVLNSKKIRREKEKCSDTTSITKEDSDASMALSVTVSDDCSQDEWILDLGNSYHMCHNRDSFST